MHTGVRRLTLAVALLAASIGWIGLMRVALAYVSLSVQPAPVADLGWPELWNRRVLKALVWPDGVTALVVISPKAFVDGPTWACRVSLKSGVADHCVELDVSGPFGIWWPPLHAHADGRIVLVASARTSDVAHVFEAGGKSRQVELPGPRKVAHNVAWDAQRRRFVVARSTSFEPRREVHLVVVPETVEPPEVEPDDLIAAVLARWASTSFPPPYLLADFPNGSTVFQQGRVTCLVGGGRARPIWADGRSATVRVGSAVSGEIHAPAVNDVWVDGRGVDAPLAPALAGLSALPKEGCQVVIQLRDDGSEEPRISCATGDGAREARLGGKLERFYVERRGREHVLTRSLPGGSMVAIAPVDVEHADDVVILAGEGAALALAGNVVPLMPEPAARERPRRWGAVRDAVHSTWRLARVGTASTLAALLTFPLLAALAGRELVTNRASRRWPVWVLLLAAHAVFSLTAVLVFGDYMLP
jgi:hypothetical protein